MKNLQHVSPVLAAGSHNPYVTGSTPVTATNPLEVKDISVLRQGNLTLGETLLLLAVSLMLLDHVAA